MPDHRALVARFLNFYPQYTLADLRTGGRLTYGEFMFLVGGMFDTVDPHGPTEPRGDKIQRAVRELAEKAAKKR